MGLEIEIRNLINEIIGGKYTGKLKVEKEEVEGEPTLWALFLYLDMEMTPLIMACQGTESQFKEFIKKEIKARKLEGVSFWKAEREILEDYDEDYE